MFYNEMLFLVTMYKIRDLYWSKNKLCRWDMNTQNLFQMLLSCTTFKYFRYLTFIMYLNDVEEGGETAFPIADNATYHENVSE